MVRRSQSKIREQILDIDPYEFEKLVAEVWKQKGYQAEVTKGSRDEGIDIEATKTLSPHKKQEKVFIQVKRHSKDNKIVSEDIRKYRTIYQQESNVDSVVIVTSGTFTDPAVKLAKKLNVETINGNKIAELIYNSQKLNLDPYLNEHLDTDKDTTITNNNVITHDLSKTAEGDDLSSRVGGSHSYPAPTRDTCLTCEGEVEFITNTKMCCSNCGSEFKKEVHSNDGVTKGPTVYQWRGISGEAEGKVGTEIEWEKYPDTLENEDDNTGNQSNLPPNKGKSVGIIGKLILILVFVGVISYISLELFAWIIKLLLL